MLSTLVAVVLLAPAQAPTERVFNWAEIALTMPVEWELVLDSVNEVRLRVDDNGGSLVLFRGDSRRPLKRSLRKLMRAGRKAGWAMVERRWTRISGQQAACVVYDIDAGGVESRQVFYLLNAGDATWMLQFATVRARFDYENFKEVAASFRLLKTYAQ